MLESGKFYLFACPWDWTFVARYVRHESFCRIVVKDAGYFTRTGATFDKLASEGFTRETQFHPTSGGPEQEITGPAVVWPWRAKTPWVKS